MIRTLCSYGLFAVLGLIAFSVLYNPGCRSPENGKRARCQSNLKQIGLAVLQYAQDNDDNFPPLQWATAIAPYAKTRDIFQCPSTTNTPGTSDYLFNARLLKKHTRSIDQPMLLILAGDGADDGPLYSTLSRLPTSWRKDENSPAGRHLGTGDYLFADGHVKALKYNRFPINVLFP